MARNARHTVLVFLVGISCAEAFLCAAVSPFRRRADTGMVHQKSNDCAAASTTCIFAGRDASSASPKPEGEQDELPPHFQSDDSVAWAQLMLDSWEETFAGQSLIRGLDRQSLTKEEQARQVAVADEAVVSHDFLRSADDPIFIYGEREKMSKTTKNNAGC